MLALWIALGIIAVVLVVTSGLLVTRSRRLGRRVVEAVGPAPAPVSPPESPPQPPPEAPAEPSATPDLGAGVDTPVLREVALESEIEAEQVSLAPVELRERLGKTRGRFAGFVRSLRARGSVDDSTWDELEEVLLGADVGVATTTSLLDDLRGRVRSGELVGPEAVLEALRDDIRESLAGAGDPSLSFVEGATNVWLFVGVNGVGKTTTIGKVAHQQTAAGRSVLLAAGDTFRAAAAEQLAMWAERTGVGIVRGAEGGDPSAVVFDAVQRAAARKNDLVLADTAGRLHTKVNLVEELKKIRRVAGREPGLVSEVLLVLDATTGQNGLAQARQFLEAVGVTGVVLTKLDGTAKGGIVLSICRELHVPVKLVGVGEKMADLVPFDAGEFTAALFDA